MEESYSQDYQVYDTTQESSLHLAQKAQHRHIPLKPKEEVVRLSSRDEGERLLAKIHSMPIEDLKQKLFKMMREEKLISDFNTTATLYSLTGLKVDSDGPYDCGRTSSMQTRSAFKQTGPKPEAGTDNRLAKKLDLSEAVIEHFLNLIMLHSVTAVPKFMLMSGAFAHYQQSELDSLMHRALAVTSIRFYSKQKGLQVFRIAYYNRKFRNYYIKNNKKAGRVLCHQLILRNQFKDIHEKQ
jgi:hypothetical protein